MISPSSLPSSLLCSGLLATAIAISGCGEVPASVVLEKCSWNLENDSWVDDDKLIVVWHAEGGFTEARVYNTVNCSLLSAEADPTDNQDPLIVSLSLGSSGNDHVDASLPDGGWANVLGDIDAFPTYAGGGRTPDVAGSFDLKGRYVSDLVGEGPRRTDICDVVAHVQFSAAGGVLTISLP